MGLDIRLPMGLMFAIAGALLVVYGVVSDPAIYRRSLGLNINLWWGSVMLVIGFTLLVLAWRGNRATRRK
ncbi:MAG: hypothetical protein DMG06_05095 [Acidobacteria bacterium]|nr:MAG: hypothetical protein DMG06_05095 [Acidobacteriota bacterium]